MALHGPRTPAVRRAAPPPVPPAAPPDGSREASWRRVVLLVVALGPAAGCSRVTRTPVVPVIDAAEVHLALDPSGPWREAGPVVAAAGIEAGGEAGGEGGRTAALARREAPPEAAPAVEEPAPAPRLAVPVSRGVGEVAPVGARPVKPLEQVAQERFLDHPTEVEAESVTLYLPEDLAREARLSGAQVSEPSPGRRVAEGGAVLTCRELTLRGARVTVRVRGGEARDVQVTARGDVAFVSRQRGQVLREEGLRSLILTNDQVTPLR